MKINSDHTQIRLVELIKRAAAREGSYSALEAAIAEACRSRPQADDGEPPGDGDGDEASTDARGKKPRKHEKFDRRKLKFLAEGRTDVPITMNELRMLDEYLVPHGDSLAVRPIFERPDVPHMLSRRPRVEFLLCARDDPEQKRTTIADSDIFAMTELQRKISRNAGITQLGFRDVIVKTDAEATRNELDFVAKGLFERSGPSLVAVGAPRVCSPAQRMLCLMFDVPEFVPQPVGRLPFHFVWSKKQDVSMPSSFDLRWTDIPDRFGKQRFAVAEGARALLWGDEIQVDEPPDWERSRDVGVICVQQRISGEIWVCVAGLSGVGTYAAAIMLEHLGQRIPQPPDSKDHGDVLWAVVEAELPNRNKSRPGLAIRQMITPRFSGQAKIWRNPHKR